jgi:hypothetical protein
VLKQRIAYLNSSASTTTTVPSGGAPIVFSGLSRQEPFRIPASSPWRSKAPACGTCVAARPGVLDTPRPLASLPADLCHTCPVCGHELAVIVADLPKGRLTQCASCGELDYRRKAVRPVSVLPGQS